MAPDDEVDELPPMDGDDDAEAAASDDDDEEFDAEGGKDALDDRTAEHDPIDARDFDLPDVGRAESGWLDNASDAHDLDLGASELSIFEGESYGAKDFEEPAAFDEDFGLLAGDEKAGLDGGEEGPSAKDEPLREEDLPPLDADEEGEVDDAQLFEPGFAEGLAQGAAHAGEGGLSRAARSWERAGAPLDVGPVRALVCARRGVVAAKRGGGLMRADLEGACEPLAAAGLPDGEIRALACEGDVLVALAEDGHAHVSRDAGKTFAPCAPCEGAAIALAGGELWIVTQPARALFRSADLGASWAGPVHVASAPRKRGRVVALAEDVGRGVVAVASEAPGSTLAVVRAGKTIARAPLEGDAALAISGGPHVCARAAWVACAGATNGLARALCEASSAEPEWALTSGIAAVTAMTFLDDEGTLLALLYREAEDTTWLVRVPVAGPPLIVAELDASLTRAGALPLDTDGQRIVHAMARDDAHGVVWLAGDFGIFAFEIPGGAS